MDIAAARTARNEFSERLRAEEILTRRAEAVAAQLCNHLLFDAAAATRALHKYADDNGLTSRLGHERVGQIINTKLWHAR